MATYGRIALAVLEKKLRSQFNNYISVAERDY